MHMIQRAVAAAHRKCSGDAVVRVHRREVDGLDDCSVQQVRI